MIFIKFQHFMETITHNKTAQEVSSENNGGPSIWETKWNVFAPISLGFYGQQYGRQLCARSLGVMFHLHRKRTCGLHCDISE
jgi:hypothetical protein